MAISNDYIISASDVNTELTSIKNTVNGKANSSHTHDDRYYTESEVDSKLGSKINSDQFSGSTYYKYCNGLLIQWGHFSHTGSHGSDVTVTFPRAFSNTNYSVTTTVSATNGMESYSNTFCHSKTTTNFKFRKITSESLSSIDYIAIGY